MSEHLIQLPNDLLTHLNLKPEGRTSCAVVVSGPEGKQKVACENYEQRTDYGCRYDIPGTGSGGCPLRNTGPGFTNIGVSTLEAQGFILLPVVTPPTS